MAPGPISVCNVNFYTWGATFAHIFAKMAPGCQFLIFTLGWTKDLRSLAGRIAASVRVCILKFATTNYTLYGGGGDFGDFLTSPPLHGLKTY